jgi:hypothetical protein|tara:strand:+ start:779 stop:1012 length:234 start_codon:yes stop_codon:yes gene_type:complete
MKVGFVLCNLKDNVVLCINAQGDDVELIPIESAKSLDRSLCLKNLTSLKTIHERFKDKGLTKDLGIENISRLYKQCE